MWRTICCAGTIALAGIAGLVGTAGASSGATLARAASPARVQATITVGQLAVSGSAPLTVGMKEGFFKAAGLNVKVVPTQAPAMVPSLLSNHIQFGFLNPPAVLIARAHHVPVVGVAAGNREPADPAKSFIYILVNPKSGIHSPSQLVGKTVAVDTLDQLPHLSAMNALRHVGVNPLSINYTEIPFPDMGAELMSNQVSAVVSVEPFLTADLALGAKKLLSAGVGMPAGTPLSEWIASQSYAKSHPAVVKAFVSAINRSMNYAQSHPALTRSLLGYTGIKPAIARKITMPLYVPGQTLAGWNVWYRILKQVKVLTGPLDVKASFVH